MIELRVHGVPKPQGSKTGFVNKRTGKVVMLEGQTAKARADFSSWREAVANEARDYAKDHPEMPLEGPVWVECSFGLYKPKAAPKLRRTWPIGKTAGDVDKLARSVLDAMTGIIFRDDGQVVRLTVSKDYSTQTGAHIYIGELEAE